MYLSQDTTLSAIFYIARSLGGTLSDSYAVA